MAEEGTTWNAPSVDKKIPRMEVKLKSTVKNLSKKVVTDGLGKKGKGNRLSDNPKRILRSQPIIPRTRSRSPHEQMTKRKPNSRVTRGTGVVRCNTGGKCECCWMAHTNPKECKGSMPAADSADGNKNSNN